MSYSIFVTGTNTSVGKTYICSLLMKKMKEDGFDVCYYKPIMSGVGDLGDTLNDEEYVAKNANLDFGVETKVSFKYENSVSPHLASKMEGRSINLEKIILDFSSLKKRFDYIIIEGCGGVACPVSIEPSFLITDLIRLLDSRTFLICDSGLGSISSCLTSAKFLDLYKIEVSGIIMNNYEFGNFLHNDNKKSMESLTSVPVVGIVSKRAKAIDFLYEYYNFFKY